MAMKFKDIERSGWYWIRGFGEPTWCVAYVTAGWSMFDWPGAEFSGPLEPPGTAPQAVAPVYAGTYRSEDGRLFSIQIRGQLAEVAEHAARLGIDDLGLLVGEVPAGQHDVDQVMRFAAGSRPQ